MPIVDIDARAQELFDECGPRATLIAAEQARAAAARDDDAQARMWRRIEAVTGLCGACSI
jgi:hypothetical protein